MAQFNHTFPNRESVLGLVKTLNGSLGQNGLDVRILEQVFNTYWPQFEERFSNVLKDTEAHAPTKPRPKEDVLGEILENTRTLNSRIRRLESENERYRSKEIPDGTMDIRINQAKEMIMAGLPLDYVVDSLGLRLPKNSIKELENLHAKIRGG